MTPQINKESPSMYWLKRLGLSLLTVAAALIVGLAIVSIVKMVLLLAAVVIGIAGLAHWAGLININNFFTPLVGAMSFMGALILSFFPTGLNFIWNNILKPVPIAIAGLARSIGEGFVGLFRSKQPEIKKVYKAPSAEDLARKHNRQELERMSRSDAVADGYVDVDTIKKAIKIQQEMGTTTPIPPSYTPSYTPPYTPIAHTVTPPAPPAPTGTLPPDQPPPPPPAPRGVGFRGLDASNMPPHLRK